MPFLTRPPTHQPILRHPTPISYSAAQGNVFRDVPVTPSPPRVRHTHGLTRYEKDVANGVEGVPVDESVKMIGPWRLGKVIGTGATGE